MGHQIIMGRKTYESLGRLLPGRQTVIVTRNPDYKVDGAIVVHSLEQAISVSSADSEAFLIGGAELYQQSLPLAKRLYLTMIDAEFEGDVYFPEIELDHWDLLEQQDLISQQGWAFHYLSYQRKA
jgi:dihydrofolate reductase